MTVAAGQAGEQPPCNADGERQKWREEWRRKWLTDYELTQEQLDFLRVALDYQDEQ